MHLFHELEAVDPRHADIGDNGVRLVCLLALKFG